MAGLTLPNLSASKIVVSDTNKLLISGTNTDAELASAISLSLDTQTATYVLAGPVSGGAAAPTFRALALTDLPTITVGYGGTGVTTLTTAYGLLAAGTTATGAVQTLAAGATTQILVGGGASALPAWGTDLPTAVTIGSAYVYRAAGTDVPVTDGGTGLSAFAVGDIVHATAATTLAGLADVAAGSYLRSGGIATVPLWSTLVLPNAATAYRLPVATAANTIGELAAGGATGEYLAGNTGAIPSWTTLNQAAIAGLTTASIPTFAGLATQVSGTYSFITTTIYRNVAFGNYFLGQTARGTAASPLASSDGDELWHLGARGWDGSAFLDCGAIGFSVEGTPSAGVLPGCIAFLTRNSTDPDPRERMRINSTGYVGIGTVAPIVQLDVFNAASSATSDPGNSQIRASALIGENARFLSLGYDTVLNAGYIQAAEKGIAWTNLILEPNAGIVIIGKTSGTEKLEVNGKIRADTAFNLNGTDGVTQATSAGKVIDVTALAGGIATAKTQVTPIADNTYTIASYTTFTTVNGRITALA